MRYATVYKRAAVALVVVLGLYVAADVVLLQVAESRAAAGLAQATAAERARAGFGGFPFLVDLARGRLETLRMSAAGPSGAGLRVASVEAEMSDVRFKPSGGIALIRSEHAPRTRITARNVIGRAEIEQDDLQEFLRRRISIVHGVRISSSGIEVRFATGPSEAPEISPPARFLPHVEEGKLALRLIGFSGAPRELLEQAKRLERIIDLPPMPKGLRGDVRLGTGEFVLEAAGPSIDVLVGEGGMRSALGSLLWSSAASVPPEA